MTQMLFRLLLLFTLLPLVELAILLWIADRTSLWFTIGLVLLTGIIGAALAKLEGWRTVRRIQTDLSAGRMPADALVDALLILVAGALLVTPGVLTDLFGFSLLLPPFRKWMKGRLKRRFADRFQIRGYWRTGDRSEIVDAKITSEDRKEQ
jgi:UPF0716 protein FxsA